MALLAVAGYTLSTALSEKRAARENCFVDGCNEAGIQQRADAVSRGNAATLLGVSGAVLLGVGVTSFCLGRRSGATTSLALVPAGFDGGWAQGLVAAIGGGF